MQTLAPRPSEASEKNYERSEFIVAFAALASQTGITKNCPLTVSDSEQQYKFERSENIGQLSTGFFNFPFFIFLKVFKGFSPLQSLAIYGFARVKKGGIDAHIWRD